ncbi:MAG: tetratricopeptide repeat protein [Thermoleophilia bacterium]
MRVTRAKRIALAAVITGVVAFAVGCSDDEATSTTASTDPFTTTTTSLVTELAPPSTVAGANGETTPTTTGDGVTANTGTTTFVLGGQTREEYESALPQLEKKVESSPKDLVAMQELAIAQYQTERYAEAADTYSAMLAVKDDALTRNNRANVLRDWGKTADAKAEYEKAIALDPALVVAYVNLSAVYLREQDTDKAIATLDRGIAKTTGEDQQRLKDIKTSTLEATATT